MNVLKMQELCGSGVCLLRCVYSGGFVKRSSFRKLLAGDLKKGSVIFSKEASVGNDQHTQRS
jgi:hypothetical protein